MVDAISRTIASCGFEPTIDENRLVPSMHLGHICGGNPKPLHLKTQHLKIGIAQHTLPSRRRLPCLDGALPVELS